MTLHFKKLGHHLLAATLILSATACKKSFFDGTPKDRYTEDNYFRTAAEVQTVTASLYGSPWYNFNCTYSMSIGDICSANSTGDANAAMIQFQNQNITTNNEYLYNGWASLYAVVGQANKIIANVTKNSSYLDSATIKTALAESRFMRAGAYFYLVRIYGAVPIVTEKNDYNKTYQVPRHIVTDVYKFIISDLQLAENWLPVSATPPSGRVARGAAKALLAKVYLTQHDYVNAKAKCLELINNEATYGVGLLPNFADLFFTKNNNNKESMWALQWLASNAEGSYATGNVTQAYSAPYGEGITGGTDGFGSFKPSFDLQRDSIAGDLRTKQTYMRVGDYYPELKQASGGYTYTLYHSPTGVNIKKYVVGNFADNASTGGVYAFSTGINTYMIRYSDVLLSYVEAVIGNGTSTSDPTAIAQFMRVRTRAGLGGIPVSNITTRDLLRERRLEFAFEGQYWFDILRRPETEALSILSNAERGVGSYGTPSPPTSNKITFTSNMLLFPIPQSEIDSDPELAKAPVPYY